MRPTPLNALRLSLATVTLVLAGTAQAVPCGGILTGGIAPSSDCRDGAAGDTSASAADLNAGNFFGSSSWSLLDSTSDGVNNAYWSFLPSDPNGDNLGLFGLADGIWNSFSQLAVVLTGRGGAFDSDIKWSAYLLPENWDTYGWTYDYVHKLGSASLFGVARTVSVPEPGAIALVLAGFGGIAVALRRRRQTG